MKMLKPTPAHRTNPRLVLHAILLGTTAIVASPAVLSAETVDCGDVHEVLPVECEQANKTTVVSMPAEPNTEWDAGGVSNSSGFVLSIDGNPINADPRVEDRIRQTDIALERADIRVTFDGLGAKPRLDFEVQGDPRTGEAVFQSRLNYPRYVERGEIRVIDLDARGGPRTVAVAQVQPNGSVRLPLPEGDNLVAVHRVYDARGRYDETNPVSLDGLDGRALVATAEEGTDNTARRRIPVRGGALTVSSNNVAPGSIVTTLGEKVVPTADGSFVIQRIMPPGSYDVEVEVEAMGRQEFTRSVEIPRAEWFYVGIADVTFGKRFDQPDGVDDTYSRGRLAGYAKGYTAGGVSITASIDTQEEELDQIFHRIDEKDPRSVLERLDPLTTYQVYGDDSRIEDDTPTSGRFYLKIEKDRNHVLWGDFQGRLDGNAYVRNERSLYGAQAVWNSPAQTSTGEARFSVQAYASLPETLPGRDVFRGTGGSVYFLQRQDITLGSTTLSIEIRDAQTGRVVERKQLIEGRDYTINHIQGSIILDKPLTSTASSGLITTNPGGDLIVNLVAQYEYTPTAGDLDGYSRGGRVEGWVSDQLRFGVSATSDDTGTADQTATAADILYQIAPNSHVRLDYARTKGPGFSSSYSTDGGLIVDNTAAVAGDGEAWKAELRADFQDLGLDAEGYVLAYGENRQQGFSTLDYQVTATTGDEDLWGIYVEHKPSERLRWYLSHDDYSNSVGDYIRETGGGLSYAFSQQWKMSIAVENLRKRNASESGERTDAAIRVDYAPNDNALFYAFGQMAVDTLGGLGDNDRVGLGAELQLGENWSVAGEVSDGSRGAGGRILVNYERPDNGSLYFGYELDPGREIGLTTTSGDDKGRYIAGGTRKINDEISIFGENTYDLFGEGNALTSAYGATYKASRHLSYDLSFEAGQVDDPVNGDLERQAVSFGVKFQDERLTARGRLEYRRDRGETSGTNRDADTILVAASTRYKISEQARLNFNLEAINTDTDQSSILDGKVVDIGIGYAYRPILNDKLNLLFSYRYLYDTYGQRVDGVEGNRPRQDSHVLSLDATYDLNQHWTLGGKLGLRRAETSPDAVTAFARNDAYLGVLSLRYHLVHNWDLLVEGRVLRADQGGTSDKGMLIAAYRHIGNNAKIGLGYNFSTFSDDLTDLTQDDKGLFLNVIAKF